MSVPLDMCTELIETYEPDCESVEKSVAYTRAIYLAL